MIDIYIPIWSYFYISSLTDKILELRFTFQYGATSTYKKETYLNSELHLHSNMELLLLKILSLLDLLLLHLHSNMELLLPSVFLYAYLQLSKFTFQYGATSTFAEGQF